MTEGNQLVVSIFLTTNRWSTTQKELRRTLAPIQCFKVCGSFDYEIRDLVRSCLTSLLFSVQSDADIRSTTQFLLK